LLSNVLHLFKKNLYSILMAERRTYLFKEVS